MLLLAWPWKAQGDRMQVALRSKESLQADSQQRKRNLGLISISKRLNSDYNLNQFGSKFFPRASKKDWGAEDAHHHHTQVLPG